MNQKKYWEGNDVTEDQKATKQAPWKGMKYEEEDQETRRTPHIRKQAKSDQEKHQQTDIQEIRNIIEQIVNEIKRINEDIGALSTFSNPPPQPPLLNDQKQININIVKGLERTEGWLSWMEGIERSLARIGDRDQVINNYNEIHPNIVNNLETPQISNYVQTPNIYNNLPQLTVINNQPEPRVNIQVQTPTVINSVQPAEVVNNVHPAQVLNQITVQPPEVINQVNPAKVEILNQVQVQPTPITLEIRNQKLAEILQMLVTKAPKNCRMQLERQFSMTLNDKAKEIKKYKESYSQSNWIIKGTEGKKSKAIIIKPRIIIPTAPKPRVYISNNPENNIHNRFQPTFNCAPPKIVIESPPVPPAYYRQIINKKSSFPQHKAAAFKQKPKKYVEKKTHQSRIPDQLEIAVQTDCNSKVEDEQVKMKKKERHQFARRIETEMKRYHHKVGCSKESDIKEATSEITMAIKSGQINREQAEAIMECIQYLDYEDEEDEFELENENWEDQLEEESYEED